VPLGFNPLCAGVLVEEVSAVLPLFDSIGAKMLRPGDIDGSQLEAEGHALVKAVAEYVLTCFWSQDP
jgi:hypothetical protein